MIPIHKLLNRIRWDPEFAKGEFTIGYYDRVLDKIVRIPLGQIFTERGDHFSFELYDQNGEQHSIPLHRIREVYKDGTLIWRRES